MTGNSGYGVPEEDIVSFLSGYNYKMSTRQKRLFLRTYGYQYSKEAEERLKMIHKYNWRYMGFSMAAGSPDQKR